MDSNALMFGLGIGAIVTIVVGTAFVWAASRKEEAVLRGRIAKLEAERSQIPIATSPGQPTVEPETRATLMAELGEATVAMTQLRRKTADYDALKEEVEELRAAVADADRTRAELDIARAQIQRLREDLARASAEAAALGSENARQKVDLASQQERLAAVERTTATLLTQLKSGPQSEVVELVQAQVEEERLQPIDPTTVAAVTFAPLTPAPKPDDGGGADPLGQIPGVGPVFEKKLWDAGIRTFQDLAGSSPETVLAVIKPEHWQQIEPELWIAEALARS